jgi:hypothetical protein
MNLFWFEKEKQKRQCQELIGCSSCSKEKTKRKAKLLYFAHAKLFETEKNPNKYEHPN